MSSSAPLAYSNFSELRKYLYKHTLQTYIYIYVYDISVDCLSLQYIQGISLAVAFTLVVCKQSKCKKLLGDKCLMLDQSIYIHTFSLFVYMYINAYINKWAA